VTIGNRLILSMCLPLAAIMALFAYLDQRRSEALLQEELLREGRAIALIAQITMEDYLRDHQIQDARELMDRITGYERVLGVRLFDATGQMVYQSQALGPAAVVPEGDLARSLRERRAMESERQVDGERVISFLMPLAGPGKEPAGAVQVLQLESFIAEATRATRRSELIMAGIMILATAVVVILVTRVSVAAPVADLVSSLREVGAGDLSARVPVRRRDEIGRLAVEFNSMAERLESTQRQLLAGQEERRRMELGLRNAERLASVGRLASGLAHEIGTPLNVIGGRTEAVQRRLSGDEPAQKNLRIIAEQIERITRIVRGMLDFARSREARLQAVDIGAAIHKVMELLDHRFAEARVRVECDLAPDLPLVMADADQLHQVFLNLATNALDAMPGGGRLRISGRRAGVASGVPDARDVEIAFEDTGVGIAAEHLNRIFDPFFTTKEVGRGTGLGLAVSYGIVRDHGGSIEVESRPGQGARFTVRLPVAGPQALLEAAEAGS
jgi:signal transduction histidine kinase